MGGLFSSPTPPAPIAPPSKSDAEVKAAADKERKRLLAKKGRKSTTHTSGQGVLGAADVEKKKLLG